MGAVGVGVGHEDDPAVAARLEVEGPARAGADHLDDRGALGVLQHVADRGLLDVEDLAADRQQRLELGVAGQLGGAERGVTLDDEQLGALVVVGPAVGELGRAAPRTPGRSCGAGSPCAVRAAIRVLAAPATFSMTSLAWAFSARLVEVRNFFSSAATTLRTTVRAAGVPRISLVWPSNCGSASRTVTTPVRPSSTSSLITSSSLTLSTLAAFIDVVEGAGDRLLEAADVGAALGRGDHVDERAQLGVVAGAPAHARRRRAARARPPAGVMCPLSSSSGTVSVNVSVPCSRRISVTGSSGARNSANSAMPPSWRNFSSTRDLGPRRSRITSSRPGTMNDVCRARPIRSSKHERRRPW